MILGCIADDFTGVTDLASMLVRGGMRVKVFVGVPDAPLADTDAAVVALKSRTIDASAAKQQSAALQWLRDAAAGSFLSTARRSIRPMTATSAR